MIRTFVCGLTVISTIVLPGSAAGQAQTFALESTQGLRLHNVVAEPATLRGKTGIRVMSTREAAADVNAELLVLIDGLEFSSGVIELELAGVPAPGAAGGARGFVGIAFRLQEDRKTYDAFSISCPTRGRQSGSRGR